MSYVIADEAARPDPVISLVPLRAGEIASWVQRADERAAQWVKSHAFEAAAGKTLAIPDARGGFECVLFGMQNEGWLYQLAAIQSKLPPGTYALESSWSEEQQALAALGWGLAAYRYQRYRRSEWSAPALLVDPDRAQQVKPLLEAQNLVRDLVNTPSEHMGPAELADAAIAVAERFGAETRVIVGEDLLNQNFPAIHAVGRASARAPRLVELSWGDDHDPLIALAGKGVCFDSGGLDLKTASGMALMKKDMGGAAHVLALAQLIMQAKLPVRLKLLIPAVENSVSGNAYRPGDVVATRKGLTIEIGNTDAEGRVVLSDALAYATEHSPDLIIDFATLTGAARVALGTDLPALFSNQREVARDMQQAGEQVEDRLWTMPLYAPYRDMIKSPIADINNSGKDHFAGCITAALFLEHFVTPSTPWVHIDTYAWNQSNRAGRPEGGEALGLRAAFDYLQSRFG